MARPSIVVTEQAKRLVGQFSEEQLWDRYKAAKLMDDKDEVKVFRQALKLKREA